MISLNKYWLYELAMTEPWSLVKWEKWGIIDLWTSDFLQLIWGTSPETHKLLFDKLFQVKKHTKKDVCSP